MTQDTPTTPITIKQLAQTLGMSHSTVSRALNGHPSISDTTRKRIEQAAAQYGYVPNSAARILKTARSGIIGLVIPDIQNKFYTTVAKAISDAATELHWQMVLAITDDQPARENVAIRSLLKAQAEGVIIVPTAAPTGETLSMLQRLHTLQLLRSHSGIRSPAIKVADRAGISMATEHLQSLGHRRIGFIGPLTEVSTGRERLQGFLDRFPDEATAKDYVQICPPRPQYAAEAFRRLLAMKEPPSGIVLGSPEFTLGVIEAASEDGVRIPDQVSLVGYGDASWGHFVRGGLTTMALPEQDIADACVDMLRVRIGAPKAASGGRGSAESETYFRPSLVLRASTCRPTKINP